MKQRGMLCAVLAYLLWGILPIFWKVLKDVSSYETICHRILWSFVLLLAVLALKKRIVSIWKQLDMKHAFMYAAGAIILALNWNVYVWAVNSNFIVEASLGYFINPLISVFLGVLVLKEKLGRIQWIAIGIAVAGVLYLTFVYGSFPWISIILAVSFAIYGLIHKVGSLGAMEGLFYETGIMLLPVLIILGLFESKGTSSFTHAGTVETVFLVLTGAATAIPMVLFNTGVRLIPLSTVGILQYIAPTLQFLIGVLLYHEPFSANRLVGFVFVWTALVIYTVDSIVKHRKRRLAAGVTPAG